MTVETEYPMQDEYTSLNEKVYNNNNNSSSKKFQFKLFHYIF